jgi:hypothetical protein
MVRSHYAAAAGIAVLATAMCTNAQAAGIQCRNGNQLVAGSYISTPYCRDELLATVARQYGMKAPADKIRYNPNFKREVCRFVGQDIRVQDNCLNEGPGIRVPRH